MGAHIGFQPRAPIGVSQRQHSIASASASWLLKPLNKHPLAAAKAGRSPR